jgi:hypothetical protein
LPGKAGRDSLPRIAIELFARFLSVQNLIERPPYNFALNPHSPLCCAEKHKSSIAGQSAQQTTTRGALSFADFSLGIQRKVSRQQAKPLLKKRLTLSSE